MKEEGGGGEGKDRNPGSPDLVVAWEKKRVERRIKKNIRGVGQKKTGHVEKG